MWLWDTLRLNTLHLNTLILRKKRWSDRPLGIACVAALKTTNARPDSDRAFFHFKSAEKEIAREVAFSAETRAGQEAELSEALLDALAEFVGH